MEIKNEIKHNVLYIAVDGVMRGVTIATDLIRPTYGGAGTNVQVETSLYPGHAIYNDAKSIVDAIKATDPAERIGVGYMKELCDKADKVSGDARKTTMILTEEILKEGHALSLHKLQLKHELDELIPYIEKEIDKVTKVISENEVIGVATTASESKVIGKLLQEIYAQIGKNGILTIEGSKTYDTSYRITNGVRFEGTGMLSQEFVYDERARAEKRREMSAIYENPLILVTKKKITTDEDINPLLVEMRRMGKKDLVIFTQDMDSGVASMLISLHKSKEFNILIIKAPVLWQGYVFEDFAKCVGATVIEDATGKDFKSMKLEDLGTCGRIEVDTEDTVITGIKDISEHCKMLAEKGDDDSLLRLSWLASKSATLKLGSNSETDLSYKLLKANDANRSTYLALQHGVVRGGGLCLASIELPDTPAGKVLSKALKAPLEQAIKNYNITPEEYEKIVTEDIVDASMVLKRAVRNAIGIASTILTAPSLVYIPKKTPEEIAYEVAVKQSSPFGR